MANFRVVAPYVTLKVRDHLGAWVLNGFYHGAVVSNVDTESLSHHLDNGLVESVDSPASAEPEPDESTEAPQPGRPGQNAPKAAWVDYAVSQRGEGVSEDDARVAAENTSKADLLAKYGG